MNQAKKKKLIVISAYLLCLSVIISLFTLSGARYLFSINGYTDFELADFNGAIFDDTTLEKISEKDVSVTALGTNSESSDFCVLKDCYPGMSAREYHFVIANGTKSTSYATIDVAFSIKVRTMYNLPLRYTLVFYSETMDGDKRVIEEITYSSVASPTALPKTSTLGSGDDAIWYEYTFLKTATSEVEQVFTLKGGSLAADRFALRVDWPIVTASGGGKDSDSVEYMEEVELIQLIASLTSENSSTKTDQTVVIHDDASEGVLIIDPDHKTESYSKTGKLTVYTYQYTAEFESFTEEDDDDGVYDYLFAVTNGNNLYKYDSDGNRIETQPAENVFYRLRFMVPYDKQTQSYKYSLTKLADSTYDTPEISYTATAIQYRKYNILMGSSDYGTYSVVSAEKAKEEIIELDKMDAPPYAIYCVYAFYPETNPDSESVNRLICSTLGDGTINDRYSVDHYVLKLTTAEFHRINKVEEDYQMYLLGEAVYQDGDEIPVIPIDYMTWAQEGE